MSPEIEEFARLLILYVRDAAIQSNDRALLSSAKHSLAKRWANAAHELPPSDFARVIIPDVVDDTIFFCYRLLIRATFSSFTERPMGALSTLPIEGTGSWQVGSLVTKAGVIHTPRNVLPTIVPIRLTALRNSMFAGSRQSEPVHFASRPAYLH